MNRNWYAVYTKAQCERKVAASLSKKKIENLCPLNRIIFNQGNRRKVAYEPLFATFVFVYVTEAEMHEVRKTADVLNFVYWLGKPAIIKDAEIENVSYFVNSYYNIKLEKTAVNSNAMIRFTNEPRMDLNGSLMTVKTTRVKLSLPSLGFAMIAETEKTGVEMFNLGFDTSKVILG